MIDYQGIIDGLTTDKVKQLLWSLGVSDIVEKSDCLITNTICHNEVDGSMKLYYYFDSHLFMCYSECGAMNIFKFLEHYYNTRHIEYDWKKDIFDVVKQCSTNSSPNFKSSPYTSLKEKCEYVHSAPPLKTYPSGALDTFVKTYPPEWLTDGISKEAMDKFDIRYSIAQNKIIIPHKDVEGNLIGIRGRALNEWEVENVGKYAPVKVENIWYSHPLSLNLYGLYENKENIKRTKTCFIGEAEKTVLQAESFPIPNCFVASCGSALNVRQVLLLIKECQPQNIVVCYDNEELEREDKYFMKLYNMCKKYSHYANFSFIYDRKHITNLKDSPTDNGFETFEQLYKERVIVK